MAYQMDLWGQARDARTPRTLKPEATEEDVLELTQRLAVINEEHQKLLGELAANRARKNGGYKDRGGCNTFLETYRPKETARSAILPGERYGKIYTT